MRHHTGKGKSQSPEWQLPPVPFSEEPQDHLLLAFSHPKIILRSYRSALCPWPQCRFTDNVLIQAHNTVACMGWIRNSLSHLMLGLSQSLKSIRGVCVCVWGGDPSASLQAFAFMSSIPIHASKSGWHSLHCQKPIGGHLTSRSPRPTVWSNATTHSGTRQQQLDRAVQYSRARKQFQRVGHQDPWPWSKLQNDASFYHVKRDNSWWKG